MILPRISVKESIHFVGLVFGVFTGTAAYLLLLILDLIHSGDADAVFLAFLSPIIVSVFSLLYTVIGAPIFLILRRMSPPSGLARFMFVMIIVAPLTFVGCAVFAVWLEGVMSFRRHYDSADAAFIVRLRETTIDHWRATLFINFCGGLACWCADRAPLLWSQNLNSRHIARITACVIFAFIASPPLIFSAFNQYVVIYRSQEIAGSRPYCMMAPSYSQSLYKTVTSRWQLSAWEMRASYELVSGTRGGFYGTNHSVLVIDNPREYMNWSYYSEDFVHDALINGIMHDSLPRDFKPCEPKRDFVSELE